MNDFEEFIEAVKVGDIEMVKIKYETGNIEVDTFDSSGSTPLLQACKGGHDDVVSYLLKAGANVDIKNYNNWTPTHTAAFDNHLSTIRILADWGCHLDEPDKRSWTPLHLACRVGNVDIVAFLIEKGVNIEAQTRDEERPLHVAMKWGSASVVDVLIEAGCLLHELTEYGETALDLANREKAYDCAETFKEALKVKSYINSFRSETKDLELLNVLRAAETGRYEDVREKKVVSMAYDVIRAHSELYMENMFHSIESTKMECLKLSVSILGRSGSESVRESLPESLMAYLKKLYEESLTKEETVILSETFLWTLCFTNRRCSRRFNEEEVTILLKYFSKYVGNQTIRVSSAFVLATEINKGTSMKVDELNDLLAFLKNMLDLPGNFIPESLLAFFTGDQEQSEMQKAFREGWNPSFHGIERGNLLGEGSFGNVFKYSDSNTKTSLAVKEVPRSSDLAIMDKMKEEIEMFRSWPCHDSILRYYGVRMDGSVMKIFMEYMSGGSLKSQLEKDGPLQSSLIAKYTKQILEGLDFLHRREIVHADLRARNILTESDETIKLCVFGLCKNVSEGNVKEINDCGLVYWAAPEVIKGGNISKKSNMWSLGATILEMLTGHPPYHKLRIFEACEKLVNSLTVDYDSPQYVSTKLRSFLSSVLERNPQKRPDVSNALKDSFILDSNLKVLSFHNLEKMEELGRGTYGTVYKCFDLDKNMFFAVKETPINKNGRMNEDIKALENELTIYKKLKSHDRILRYLGTTRNEKSMNIYMEYMPGKSLKEKLITEKKFPTTLIARYTKQILQGLDFLHNKAIIHRDIKPANILKDEDNNVKLCDFGISKRLKKKTFNRTEGTVCMTYSKKSMAETNIGTICYMAPEVVRGEKYNVCVDVWSLGATVVEMFTGNPPFHDLEYCAAARKIGEGEYELPSSLPSSLQAFLEKMFVDNPLERATVARLLQCDFIMDEGVCVFPFH